MRALFFIFLVVPLNPVVAQARSSQSEAFPNSDIGYWISLQMGTLTSGNEIENSWTIVGGFDGRFSRNWSVPIELQIFRLNNDQTIKHVITAALKFRVPLFLRLSNFYVQGGLSSGMSSIGSPVSPTFHYAGGVEFGLFDRVSFSMQAKKYVNIHLDSIFLTAGININVTSY